LLTGLAGVALTAGCGALERTWPTLDPFYLFLSGSVWSTRSDMALLAGFAGVVLFHLCVRRVSVVAAPAP
jgi:hypothetical protein